LANFSFSLCELLGINQDENKNNGTNKKTGIDMLLQQEKEDS